jgi:hypothetical protein
MEFLFAAMLWQASPHQFSPYVCYGCFEIPILGMPSSRMKWIFKFELMWPSPGEPVLPRSNFVHCDGENL